MAITATVMADPVIGPAAVGTGMMDSEGAVIFAVITDGMAEVSAAVIADGVEKDSEAAIIFAVARASAVGTTFMVVLVSEEARGPVAAASAAVRDRTVEVASVGERAAASTAVEEAVVTVGEAAIVAAVVDPVAVADPMGVGIDSPLVPTEV